MNASNVTLTGGPGDDGWTDGAGASHWNGTAAGAPTCHAEADGAFSSPAFRTLIYLMYTAVFCVSLAGNGLVCYVVVFSAQMHSVTNLFIMNMAVGDLLMTLFCVPFSFVATLLLQYWPFGNDLCHTVSFAQAVAVLVRFTFSLSFLFFFFSGARHRSLQLPPPIPERCEEADIETGFLCRHVPELVERQWCFKVSVD